MDNADAVEGDRSMHNLAMLMLLYCKAEMFQGLPRTISMISMEHYADPVSSPTYSYRTERTLKASPSSTACSRC